MLSVPLPTPLLVACSSFFSFVLSIGCYNLSFAKYLAHKSICKCPSIINLTKNLGVHFFLKKTLTGWKFFLTKKKKREAEEVKYVQEKLETKFFLLENAGEELASIQFQIFHTARNSLKQKMSQTKSKDTDSEVESENESESEKSDTSNQNNDANDKEDGSQNEENDESQDEKERNSDSESSVESSSDSEQDESGSHSTDGQHDKKSDENEKEKSNENLKNGEELSDKEFRYKQLWDIRSVSQSMTLLMDNLQTQFASAKVSGFHSTKSDDDMSTEQMNRHDNYFDRAAGGKFVFPPYARPPSVHGVQFFFTRVYQIKKFFPTIVELRRARCHGYHEQKNESKIQKDEQLRHNEPSMPLRDRQISHLETQKNAKLGRKDEFDIQQQPSFAELYKDFAHENKSFVTHKKPTQHENRDYANYQHFRQFTIESRKSDRSISTCTNKTKNHVLMFVNLQSQLSKEK
ncbi:hypothetical protein RFI_11187 [Reticulomyxa filosa]|uniref:Uncharacterized protein n=1 Tax=Reticulomyxa filosa TaxID=46433 RepID=X6NKR4_RETFI|nr:hypothetical protein RFI_11187 [Reticulomyxa filosa]|eukprot:ETO25952.1 hypothetical protein RFI_11187 [Reticulomyxa filosa]